MSNLRKILQAMEELHRLHPQPFMHMVEKYCSHKEPQEAVIGHVNVGFRIERLETITTFSEEAILWFLNNIPNMNRPVTTPDRSYSPLIFQALKELDEQQGWENVWDSFSEFHQSICTMSWPSDGDCNDYYNDDWEVFYRIKWELENA